MTWQTIDTCPENTWVLLAEPWAEAPSMAISKFRWEKRSAWEIVNESSGASGARRQTRQEKIATHRVWDNGLGQLGDGDYKHWMPLPEMPSTNA
jgi:hypothetical protein